MVLNVEMFIYIIPTKEGSAYKGNVILLDNIKEYHINSSWEDLMTTGEVKLSRRFKNIRIYNEFGDNAFDPGNYTTLFNGSLSPINSTQQDEVLQSGIVNNPYINYTNDNVFGFKQKSANIKEDAIINRGDIIYIVPKYSYFDDSTNTPITTHYNEKNSSKYAPESQIFVGYITGIKAEADITLKVADYMYFFNQLRIPNYKYLASKFTLNDLIVDLIKKGQEGYGIIGSNPGSYKNVLKPIWGEIDGVYYGFITDDTPDILIENFNGSELIQWENSETKSIKNATVGDITCENATFGMVLKELKNKYMMVPFFYPGSNYLNITPFKYNDNPKSDENPYGYTKHTFSIQKNIIFSSLEFRKIDDVLCGAYIKSVYKIKTTETTADGKNKSHTKSLQYFVGQAGGDIKTFFYDRNDKKVNSGEEAIASGLKERMIARGEELLKQTIYEGYYGSFTTFGFPYVKHGDIVSVIDEVYPERCGQYRVKKVRSFGGVSTGLRQEIFLDIKIGNDIPPALLNQDQSNYIGNPYFLNQEQNKYGFGGGQSGGSGASGSF